MSEREPAGSEALVARPLGRLARTYGWMAVALLAIGAVGGLIAPQPLIAADFFLRQDLPVLVATTIFLLMLARWKPPGFAPALPGRPVHLVLAGAGTAAVIAWAGTHLVYADYALSMDEFMARFDAIIFSRGRLFAELPETWSRYRHALQPIFLMETPSPDHWASAYLPVNAAIRGAARLLHIESLVGPLWAAASVLAIYAVARRLWPADPGAGLVAAGFLAVSPQFLVNAMTAYAMPAHLALNLLWLWCFLRGGRAGHAGAIALGFLACGLHQVVFHPLFVAPFILQLGVERRWRTAAAYAAAYAAIGLFWIFYWQVAFAWAGLGEAAVRGFYTGAGFLDRVVDLVLHPDPAGLSLMAENVVRFVTWQSPLAAPLAVLAAWAALKEGGTMRSLLLGVALTLAVMLVVLPFQGHGWGYRYLHGVLGSVCLLAAWTWRRLTAALEDGEARRAVAVLGLTLALSLLILLPLRAWQAHGFVDPYASASAAIERAAAEVVIVDSDRIWYGDDLVRNDPFLERRPLVMSLAALSDDEVRTLCAGQTVALFDFEQARSHGIRIVQSRDDEATAARRALMRDLECGG